MGFLSSLGGIVGSVFGGPVGGAIGGALGGLGDSAIGSNAAKNAAKDQSYAADAAANSTMAMYNQNRADLAPWRTAGGAAVTKLGDLTGVSGNTGTAGYGSLTKAFGSSDFQTDPGYQFRLAEGQKALDRSLSAKGGLLSGAAVKAGMDYNQGMASDEYGKAYSRYTDNQTNVYNKLSGLAGLGQTATNNTASQGAAATTTANGYLTDSAAAKAAGSVASSNAWSTGLNSAGNTLGNFFNMYPGGKAY